MLLKKRTMYSLFIWLLLYSTLMLLYSLVIIFFLNKFLAWNTSQTYFSLVGFFGGLVLGFLDFFGWFFWAFSFFPPDFTCVCESENSDKVFSHYTYISFISHHWEKSEHLQTCLQVISVWLVHSQQARVTTIPSTDLVHLQWMYCKAPELSRQE